MRIRKRPQQTRPPSDLLPPGPSQPGATLSPPLFAPPVLHPKKEEKEEEKEEEQGGEEEHLNGEGRASFAQVMRGKQQQGEVGGAHKTENIGGVHGTAGRSSSSSSSSGTKVEDDGGLSEEADDEKKESGGGGGRKRRRRPAVLMEGSRCSRVNGRGWRCCQQTLVGYSLCEHHLGKGRLRSVSSVRCNGGGRRKAARNARCDGDEEPRKWKKRGKRLGMIKARSISSLLHQTDQAPASDPAGLPALDACGRPDRIGAMV